MAVVFGIVIPSIVTLHTTGEERRTEGDTKKTETRAERLSSQLSDHARYIITSLYSTGPAALWPVGVDHVIGDRD